MRIFPADNVSTDEVSKMIDELSTNGLIAIYSYENRRYLQIADWTADQRIDRPTYQFPDRNGVIPAKATRAA